MNDFQDDFSPILVDQQIDQPDLLSPEDARLIHEVRAMFEQEKSAWIEQGWARLMRQRANADQQPEVLDFSAYRQNGDKNAAMNESFALPLQAATKKRRARLPGLLAAVLVCIALVGCLSFVLAAARNQTAKTGVGSHGTTATAQAATVAPSPTPTLTIPSTCKDTMDLADEVLCAKGEQTVLNITRSFTITAHNPDGSSKGPGTISITFHRAYADPVRLMLVYTITRAPGTDWGGFVTLSTRQGMIGSGGACLFKGFCVQSFDTSTLPAGIKQLQVQAINTAYGASIPLSFSLPFHATSKTVSIKQTVTSKGNVLTLDHIVLTGSTTGFAITYKLQKPNGVDVLMKVTAITINGQQQAEGAGWSGNFGDNGKGEMSGQMNFYQSFLDQPGSWTVEISLVKFEPAATPSPLVTGTFTFNVPA